MREQLIAISLLAAAGLLSHGAANAGVMRCSDAGGNTLYTDSACPAGMRAAEVTSLPQSCTTQDCDRRRALEIDAARERLRAEKEELAAYAAERHRREIEDRSLDEMRYAAELSSIEATRAPANDVVYSGYPIVGFPMRCGMHCLSSRRHHKPGQGINRVGEEHHGIKGSGNRIAVRTGGVQPRRAMILAPAMPGPGLASR
jgi:hypothetical protein